MKNPYTWKAFGIDACFVAGAVILHFLYGALAGLMGIPENYYVTLVIGFFLFAILLYSARFAALFYAILNFNIFMVAFFLLYYLGEKYYLTTTLTEKSALRKIALGEVGRSNRIIFWTRRSLLPIMLAILGIMLFIDEQSRTGAALFIGGILWLVYRYNAMEESVKRQIQIRGDKI